MASDELKEMRKNLTKEAVRDHQMATTGGTQTDLFTCGKCKGKHCTYTQVHIANCVSFVFNSWRIQLSVTLLKKKKNRLQEMDRSKVSHI